MVITEVVRDALRGEGLLPFVENNENSVSDSQNNVRIAVYENEIKRPWRGYGSEPIKFLVPRFDRARYSNDDGSVSIRSLSHLNPIPGYDWLQSNWQVVIDKDTDAQGYQYAHRWDLLTKNATLNLSDSFAMNVRRRKWTRTLIQRKGDNAKYGQMSKSVKFVPFELLLAIKRADLQGFTSSTYVEIYLDGKLVERTNNGPSEWNKLVIIPFYYCPEENHSSVTCVVKSDMVFDKLKPEYRIKGEISILNSDILSTKTQVTDQSINFAIDKVYPFVEPFKGSLTVGINFLEHKLFTVVVDTPTDSIHEDVSRNALDNENWTINRQSVQSLSSCDSLRVKTCTSSYFESKYLHFERYPKVLNQIKELLSFKLPEHQGGYLFDFMKDIFDIIESFLSPSDDCITKALKLRGFRFFPTNYLHKRYFVPDAVSYFLSPAIIKTLSLKLQHFERENFEFVSAYLHQPHKFPIEASTSHYSLYVNIYVAKREYIEDTINCKEDNVFQSNKRVSFQFNSELESYIFLKLLNNWDINDASLNEFTAENVKVAVNEVPDAFAVFDIDNGQRFKSISFTVANIHTFCESMIPHVVIEFIDQLNLQSSYSKLEFALSEIVAIESQEWSNQVYSDSVEISVTRVEGADISNHEIVIVDGLHALPLTIDPPLDYSTCRLLSCRDPVTLTVPVNMKYLEYCEINKKDVSPIIIQVYPRVFESQSDQLHGICTISANTILQCRNGNDVSLKIPLVDFSQSTCLQIRILSANGLIAADSGGTSDPYVIVYICDAQGNPVSAKSTGSPISNPKPSSKILNLSAHSKPGKELHEYQLPADSILFSTDVVKKSCSPNWNASLSLSSTTLCRGSYICLEVWDSNRITSHTCLGYVLIPISFNDVCGKSPENGESEEVELKISASKKTPTKYLVVDSFGSLRLGMKWTNQSATVGKVPKSYVIFSLKCNPLLATNALWPCRLLTSDTSLKNQCPMTVDVGDQNFFIVCIDETVGVLAPLQKIVSECVDSCRETNVPSTSMVVCRIPWNQVLDASLVASANAVFCRIILYRKFTESILKPVEINLLTYNCPASEVHGIITDRISVFNLRKTITRYTIPMAIEIDSVRKALEPFIQLCKDIDQNIGQITKNSSLENISTTKRVVDSLRRSKMRLKLYCSFIIDESFHQAVNANETMSNLTEGKLSAVLSSFEDKSAQLPLRDRFSNFSEALREDIWKKLLKNRRDLPDMLCKELTYILHATYLKMTRHLLEMLDSEYDTKNSLAETKRSLLRCIVINDSIFVESLQSAFSAFDLKFSRTPLLTHTLDFEELQREMFRLLTDEINYFLTKSFINLRQNSADDKLTFRHSTLNSSEVSNHIDDTLSMPWSLEPRGKDNLLSSNIPEDAMFQLQLQIENRIINPLAEWGQQNIEVIQQCNLKVAMAVADSFIKLKGEYHDAIIRILSEADALTNHLFSQLNEYKISGDKAKMDQINGRINDSEDKLTEFLCSVVNDIDRVINDHIPFCKRLFLSSTGNKRNEIEAFVGEDDERKLPLLAVDIDEIFLKCLSELKRLIESAIAHLVTRFYKSFSISFLDDIENKYFKIKNEQHFHPIAAVASTGVSIAEKIISTTIFEKATIDNVVERRYTLDDICSLIQHFSNFVMKNLLERYHSIFIKDLFCRLIFRYLTLLRDTFAKQQELSGVLQIEAFNQGPLRKAEQHLRSSLNSFFRFDQRDSLVTTNVKDDNNRDFKRTSYPKVEPILIIVDEFVELLLTDAQAIQTCFSKVIRSSYLDPETQLILGDEYGVNAFVNIVQHGCFPDGSETIYSSESVERQVYDLYHTHLPTYSSDFNSRMNKLREFLLSNSLMTTKKLIDESDNAPWKYFLQISHFECFNIRFPINSFVRVKIDNKILNSSVQPFTTKPVFSEQWEIILDTIEDKKILIQLLNFRPVRQLIGDYVIGTAVIPVSSLIVGKPLTAWYKLYPPSDKGRRNEIYNYRGEANPSRDCPLTQIQVTLKLTIQEHNERVKEFC